MYTIFKTMEVGSFSQGNSGNQEQKRDKKRGLQNLKANEKWSTIREIGKEPSVSRRKCECVIRANTKKCFKKEAKMHPRVVGVLRILGGILEKPTAPSRLYFNSLESGVDPESAHSSIFFPSNNIHDYYCNLIMLFISVFQKPRIPRSISSHPLKSHLRLKTFLLFSSNLNINSFYSTTPETFLPCPPEFSHSPAKFPISSTSSLNMLSLLN